MVSTRRAPATLPNAATAVDSQPSTSATTTSSRARRGAQDKTKKATKGRDVSAVHEEAVEEAGILDGAAAQDSKPEGAHPQQQGSTSHVVGGHRHGGGAAADIDDDGDDDLLSIDLEQMAASIRLAMQQSDKPSGARGDDVATGRDQEEDSDDEQQEEDEEGSDGEHEPGARKLGVQPAAAPTKDPSEGLQLWDPRVPVPRAPEAARARAVHQREPVQADKEPGLSKKLLVPPRDPQLLAKAARKAAPDTTGKRWFDMGAPKIDDQMKQDLRVLRLRGAFDPKKFYKNFDRSKFPKYFQMGTVVDSALDFYGGRLTKAQRKATLTEQLLADAEVTQARKKRYAKLQEEAQKYSKVGAKRKAGGAPRLTKNVKHTKR